MRLNPSEFFPESYLQSRATFRRLVKQLGWQQESHSIGQEAPDGTQLTLDVGISDDDGRRDTVVVSSGVHGVEGFFGAAVQAAVLNQILDGEFPPARWIFLHAVNPYGFAWLRRFDECNVDPNRNFLLHEDEYQGCPDGYRTLDPFLNPKQAPSRFEFFMPKALLKIVRHGLPTLQQAIAAGQYEFPKGIFFGGHGPSASNQILRQQMGRWLGSPDRVVHLDFHTGLGRWGSWKLLVDQPLSVSQRHHLESWFGSDSYHSLDSTEADYQTRGGFGHWCPAQDFARDYLFANAEFGTFHPLRVLAGLRKENQTHHWAQPGSQDQRRAKARLLNLFCPNSATWRASVLRDGCELVRLSAKSLQPA